LAKPNYSFEKRQRELAKKKQQDEKQAKKKATRENANRSSANATRPWTSLGFSRCSLGNFPISGRMRKMPVVRLRPGATL
jgi:hypothetical protein